jgi:hypothetical protein
MSILDQAATEHTLADTFNERARQDAKWGQQSWPNGTGKHSTPLAFHKTQILHDNSAIFLAVIATASTDARAAAGTVTWRDIFLEEVFEAVAESDTTALRAELIQTAAVALAWAEDIDRKATK